MNIRTLQSTSSDVRAFHHLFLHCPHIFDIVRWAKQIGLEWADEILRRGTITAPSAISGDPIEAVGLLTTSTRTTFLEFQEPGHQPYCLVASRVGFGYPIASIYFPDLGFLFHWEDQKFGFGRVAVENYHHLKYHRAKHRISVGPLSDGVCLFLGHENFAHHLLNELTGVWRAKEAGLLHRVRKVFAQYEPIGPLGSLIPECGAIPRQTVKVRENFNILGRHNILLIGGVSIPAGLRARLRLAVTEMVLPLYPREVDTVMATPGHRVSLAVRTHSKVVENNNKMILALCNRLQDSVGEITPVLDGFSLPHDVRVNPNYLPWFMEKGQISETQVDGIAAQFRTAGFKAVLSTANKDVILALWMSMQNSFYFSNQGTQQHKAGWLSDARGVVHFPPDKPRAIGWFRGLDEGGPAFSLLPNDFIKAFGNVEGVVSAGYEFQDVENAANWVVDTLTR